VIANPIQQLLLVANFDEQATIFDDDRVRLFHQKQIKRCAPTRDGPICPEGENQPRGGCNYGPSLEEEAISLYLLGRKGYLAAPAFAGKKDRHGFLLRVWMSIASSGG
jgi:hypothetical protein